MWEERLRIWGWLTDDIVWVSVIQEAGEVCMYRWRNLSITGWSHELHVDRSLQTYQGYILPNPVG